MEKKPLRTMLFGLSLLAAVNAHGDSLPERMELSRTMAVAMAIRKNPDLRVEAFYSSMAETDAARSRGLYDPLFSASASGGINAAPGDAFFRTRSGNASIGLTQYLPTGGSVTLSPQTGFTNAEFDDSEDSTTDWQSSIGINVYQPLLRNAGKESTEIGITLAASALGDSLEQFRFTTTDTVFAVITAYNRFYTLRQNREWRMAALTSAQTFLEEIRRREKPGALHGMEIANAEYAIAQRQRDLVVAERSVRDQEAYLRYLIGMPTKMQIIPLDPPSRDEPPETEAQAVQAALEFRPDLKQLRSTLRTSLLQERVARRQALPDLSLTAGGGLTGTGESFSDSTREIGDQPGTFWSAGLQFSVPLGNTALENDYRRSKIRTEQVQSQIEALSWRIRNEIESDMRALISARLQMQTADRALQYAEQRLAEYRKNVHAGSTSVQDVLNAENDLVYARNGQLDAVETFAYSVVKLWRDAGVLLERQRIRIDTSRPDKLTEGMEMAPSPAPIEASPAPAAEATGMSGPTTDAPPAEPGAGEQQPAPVDKEKVSPPAEDKTESGAGEGEKTGEAAAGQPVAPDAAPAVAVGGFTLHVGEYAGMAALAQAREKIRSAGLSPQVTEGPKRVEPMIRLYSGEFPDPASARRELDRLRRAGADGFILDGGGRYVVYAGSYRKQAGAVREQKRLAARGIEVSLKKADVPMPTFLLTADSFPTREEAARGALKLEQQGLKAVVVETGTELPGAAHIE